MTDTTEGVKASYQLNLTGVDYTVTVHGREGNADGSDILIAIEDSREGTNIVRQLPRVPDLLKDPQLLMDLLTDTTVVDADAPKAAVTLAAGAVVTSADPDARFADEYGNTFALTYRPDSSGHYAPAITVVAIKPDFATAVFVDFVRASAKALVDTNARVAAHGTHLRNAKSELAKLDRETRGREAAARDLVAGLSTSREFHRAHASLRAHQVEVMRKVLIQYASPDSWTGEPEGFQNKLASNIDGFSLAKNALADVTMDDVV